MDLFANADPASGFVVRPWDFPVAVAVGWPVRSVIEAATEGAEARGTAWAGEGSEGEWHLLAAQESLEAVAVALSGRRRRGVTLHTRTTGPSRRIPNLPESWTPRVAAEGCEAAGWNLDHLPAVLRREYRIPYVRRRPIAAAFDGELPVAFCYSAVSTESLWDVAVDTLPDYRGRGLAGACFEALAKRLAASGRQPVWGALDENEPSMKLAAKLGFRPAATLTSFVWP